MTNVQERIAELMSEVHDICEANGITYYVEEQQALQAAINHTLDGNVTNGKILMTADNYLKFIEAFEASPIEGREIEYLKNNGYYPFMNIKYVDTGSVYYNMKRLACERCLGIYVSINLLKPVTRKSKIHQAIEQTWESMAYGEDIVGKRLGPLIAYRFKRSIEKHGRDKTASNLFDYLVGQYSGSSRRNEYWTIKKTGKKVSKHNIVIPAEQIAIDLNGHQLYTFEAARDSIKALKSKYKYRIAKEFTNDEMSFIDADIPYKELHLEQFRNSIRALSAKSYDIRRPATRIRKARRKFFRKLNRTRARYYYGLQFENQIDDLERMLDEGQYDQLEEIMDPYVEELVNDKNIYISDRINRILTEHYKLDLEAVFNDVPEFYREEGIKIYDYNGNYIRTVAGTKDD